MPYVRQNVAFSGGRHQRTLNDGRVFVFEDAEPQEVSPADLLELLRRSPKVLQEVEPEFRGKEKEPRRWRPIREEEDEPVAEAAVTPEKAPPPLRRRPAARKTK